MCIYSLVSFNPHSPLSPTRYETVYFRKGIVLDQSSLIQFTVRWNISTEHIQKVFCFRSMTTLSERIGKRGCRKAASQARNRSIPEGHLFDGALTLICRLLLLLTWLTTMIFVGLKTSGWPRRFLLSRTPYLFISSIIRWREKFKIGLEWLLWKREGNINQ